jgi:SH3-like domain-containing protein
MDTTQRFPDGDETLAQGIGGDVADRTVEMGSGSPSSRRSTRDDGTADRTIPREDGGDVTLIPGATPFAALPTAPEPPKPRVALVMPPDPPAAPADRREAVPGRAPSPGGSRRWMGWLVVAVFGMALGGAVARWQPWSREASVASSFVDAPGLNVRAGPGTGHPILVPLLRGDAVQVIGRDTRDPDWVRVRVGDVRGWVNGRYLSATRPLPRAPSAPAPPHVTLQYQAAADRQMVTSLQAVLRRHVDWRVGEPEHVLPTAENRPEVYGGLRFYFESDSALARTVCNEVVAELARRGMTVTMPLWPMVTGQREGRFHATPGLVEVWVSPLPAAASAPVFPGRCGW